MLVRRPCRALGFPQRFRKRLQHGVLGLVRIAQALLTALVDLRDAGGPIGGDLLADRQVQAHVQEGVFAAAFGGEFGAQGLRAGLQPWDIFRVLGDDCGELRFQRLERLP